MTYSPQLPFVNCLLKCCLIRQVLPDTEKKKSTKLNIWMTDTVCFLSNCILQDFGFYSNFDLIFQKSKWNENSCFNKKILRRPTTFSHVLDWECRKINCFGLGNRKSGYLKYRRMNSKQNIRIFNINCICLEHRYYLPRPNNIFLSNSFCLVLLFWELQWPKLWWSLRSSNLPSAWESHQDH